MSLMDDRFLQAVIFLVIPTVLLIGTLLLEANVCISMVLLIWMLLGLFLVYLPLLSEADAKR
ncbi:MAG: hypothetical protein PWQ88_742 [Candidatus Methanomethylophilaceae archaeon]|nr:MAG: hypothetical protein XE14_0003 [Thermoplasmatales archaeon 49_6]MDI3482871.1 hypothetical protein [Candidatus Methanomethylophilaceae archaeon]MDI3541886.1 hypothetical protein [Candidatus Methanomethylophilaceae archaeon]HIJ00736.1 hypothetical protein [Candidatus Methanomethylophilaceae archaeon]